MNGIRIVLAIALTAQAAGAVDLGTPAEQRACKSDVLRLCAEAFAAGDLSALRACVVKQKPNMSRACRDMLTAKGL